MSSLHERLASSGGPRRARIIGLAYEPIGLAEERHGIRAELARAKYEQIKRSNSGDNFSRWRSYDEWQELVRGDIPVRRFIAVFDRKVLPWFTRRMSQQEFYILMVEQSTLQNK